LKYKIRGKDHNSQTQRHFDSILVIYCIIAEWAIINRRERDYWGDLDVDGWIILRWFSRRWDVGIWTGLGWPRIETGGRRL